MPAQTLGHDYRVQNANAALDSTGNLRYDFTYTSSDNDTTESLFRFIVDSGASAHMSDQRSFFKNLRPREKGAHTVTGIAGHKLDVEAIGDIEVINSFGLDF